MLLSSSSFLVNRGSTGLSSLVSFLTTTIGHDAYLIDRLEGSAVSNVLSTVTVFYRAKDDQLVEEISPRENYILTTGISGSDLALRVQFSHPIRTPLVSGSLKIDGIGVPGTGLIFDSYSNGYTARASLAPFSASGHHRYVFDSALLRYADGTTPPETYVGGYTRYGQASAYLGDSSLSPIKRRGTISSAILYVSRNTTTQNAINQFLASNSVAKENILSTLSIAKPDSTLELCILYISNPEPQFEAGYPFRQSLVPFDSAVPSISIKYTTKLDPTHTISTSGLFELETGYNTRFSIPSSAVSILPDGKTVVINLSSYLTEKRVYTLISKPGIRSLNGFVKIKPEIWTVVLDSYVGGSSSSSPGPGTTGDVTSEPLITFASSPNLTDYRLLTGHSGVATIVGGSNGSQVSLGLSGNMYHNITGHTGNSSIHYTEEGIQDVVGAMFQGYTGMHVIYNDVAGTVLLSGQRATTSTLGIAQFDPANFAVSTGNVSVSAIPTGVVTDLPLAVQDTIGSSGFFEYRGGLTGLWNHGSKKLTLSLNTGIPVNLEDLANVLDAAQSEGYLLRYNDGDSRWEGVEDASILVHSIFSSPTGTAMRGAVTFTGAGFVNIWSDYPNGRIIVSGASGIPTGYITNLPLAVKDTIGNSGMFLYRGGLTGLWDQGSRQLTLNWISGRPSYALDDLTDVTVGLPLEGNLIAFNEAGSFWESTGISAVAVSLLASSPTGVPILGSITFTGQGGVTLATDYATNRIIISGQTGTRVLDDLTDVILTSPLSGHPLIYDGINWRNSGLTTGNVVGLVNATKDTIGNSGFFEYRGGLTGIWDNPTKKLTLSWISGQTAGASALDDLTDVIVTAGASGQALVYDGINWRNSGLTTGNITLLTEAIQDTIAGSLATTTGLSVVYNDTTHTITLSGERASTSTVGLAAFDSSQFTVNSGHAVISQIATGIITSLPNAIKDTIGSSGFFEYRGGLTGIWNHGAKQLTLDWISGSVAGATVIDDLTDVSFGTSPLNGEILAYSEGAGFWGNTAISSMAVVSISSSPTGVPMLGGLTLTGQGRTRITSDYGTSRILISGSSDHGAMTGLSNDDHLIYSLANGSRPFTGPVDSPAPTGISSLTNKSYVDTQDLIVFNYFAAYVLDSLVDVITTTPVSGQVLGFDGVNWRNSGLTTGNITLLPEAIKDTIGNSGFFEYRGGLTGIWDNPTEKLTLSWISGAGGSSSLDGLTDVAITSPVSGHVVTYNGSSWVNSPNTWNQKIKTANENRAVDSAILVCDNTLFVDLAADTNYTIRGRAMFTTNSTPDFKYAFTGVTGSEWIITRQHILPDATGFTASSVDKWPAAYNSGVTGVQFAGVRATSSKVITVVGNAGVGTVEWDAIILNSGNTGIFGLLWAQNTSNLARTTVWAGSSIEWRIM
jgi:hypothetical protein